MRTGNQWFDSEYWVWIISIKYYYHSFHLNWIKHISIPIIILEISIKMVLYVGANRHHKFPHQLCRQQYRTFQHKYIRIHRTNDIRLLNTLPTYIHTYIKSYSLSHPPDPTRWIRKPSLLNTVHTVKEADSIQTFPSE